MSAFAPKATLTSAVRDWGKLYGTAIEELASGQIPAQPRWLGMREEVVGLTPPSDRLPPDLIALVRQRWQELVEGERNVFTGPIRDVDGDVRLASGRVLSDIKLAEMDFFVDGVLGIDAADAPKLVPPSAPE